MEKQKKFRKVPVDVPVSELSPLNISCGTTKCSDELHCFKSSRRVIKEYGKKGVCKDCGADMIDWNRIHKNNLQDSSYIFDSMQNELIRHIFWHTDIEPEAITKALARGRVALKERAFKRLRQKVGTAQNYREGQQTPMVGNEIICYAQHATATCCRKCLEYWHNMPPAGTELSQEQLEYCTELVMLYIEDRVPTLTDEGEPSKKKAKNEAN